MYGLRTRIRKWKRVVRRNVPVSLKTLTTSRHTPSALGESVQTTVYATMQPAKTPPPMSASMGAEGSSSGSGALDVIVKCDAKKSIVVYVVYVVRGLNVEL